MLVQIVNNWRLFSFVLKDDSVDGIFDTLKDHAKISKFIIMVVLDYMSII